MLPSDETEIKVLFYFLITGIFIITLTKRTHKRSVNNDYFAASLSVSLTNPFDNFINPFERFSYPFENLIHPFGNFIHLLKWIANLLKQFIQLLNGLQIRSNLYNKRLVKPFERFLDCSLSVLFCHLNSLPLVTVLPFTVTNANWS